MCIVQDIAQEMAVNLAGDTSEEEESDSDGEDESLGDICSSDDGMRVQQEEGSDSE